MPNSTENLGRYGEELMDPDSDYSKLMQSKLSGEIGQNTEAQRRLASFDAAQSGAGAGGSPELSSMMTDIGIAGGEAEGEGMVDLLTGGTRLGLGAMGTAQQGELGYEGMDMQRQFEEQRRQDEQQRKEMENHYRDREMSMQQQRDAEDAKWREFSASQSMDYGGGGGDYSYGGGSGGGGYDPGGGSGGGEGYSNSPGLIGSGSTSNTYSKPKYTGLMGG